MYECRRNPSHAVNPKSQCPRSRKFRARVHRSNETYDAPKDTTRTGHT